MTTGELAKYYADLLILQYRGKPKAHAHVTALVTPFLMDQLPLLVQQAYDIDVAVGVQLYVLAKYAGVYSPIPGATPNIQKSFTQVVTLTDDQLRQLIKIKIIQNYSGISLADVQSLIALFFAGTIQVFDHKNMTMGYYFDASFGSQELAEVFIRGGFLPKPMGVLLNSVIYAVEALTTGFFGFKRYGEPVPLSVGFKRYGQDPTGPWLRYTDAIALP